MPSKSEILRQSYQRLFDTEDGIRVLEDLKSRSHYGMTFYTEGMSDKDFSFAAGKQDTANHIMWMLTKKEEGKTK